MITTLLILLGLAMLSIEIAYHAVLCRQIKSILWLDDFHQGTLKTLLKFKFWHSVNKWLTPIALLFKIWYELSQLINCQYCTAAQLGFWITLLYLHQSIILSLAFAGICIIFVLLVEKFIL